MNNKPSHYTYREHVLRLTALVGQLASMAGEPVEFQAILRHLDELEDRAALLREQVVLIGSVLSVPGLKQAVQRKRAEQEGLF